VVVKLVKAVPEQAFLKVGGYGLYGSGKTFTFMLIAEWLAKQEGKRVALIESEPRGSDFLCQAVPERKVHPEAFDFDRANTRAVFEIRDVIRSIDTDTYGVVLLDGATAPWESAKEAYTGKLTTAGTYPMQAWGPIKKPYKQIFEAGMVGNFHFLFTGREGLIFEKDAETGKDEVVGTKMKAEGETPYEPHVLIQMFQTHNAKTGDWIINAYFERDRSGRLQGKTVAWPSGDLLAPIYALMSGKTQGQYQGLDGAAESDATAATAEREGKLAETVATYEAIRRAVLESSTKVQLESAWNLTKGKKKILGDDRFEILSALVDGRLAEIREREGLSPRKEGVA
jgi:hypothetical protein